MRELDDITEAKRGFYVERQTAVRFEDDGLVFEEGFRPSLRVTAPPREPIGAESVPGG